MELALTKEAVKTMFHMWSNKNEVDFVPTLQIVHLKELTVPAGCSSKWKVVMSDGAYLMTGVCSGSLSQHFETGYIQNGTVIRLSRFNIEMLTNIKKICIVVDAKVLSTSMETVGKDHRDVNFIWKRED